MKIRAMLIFLSAFILPLCLCGCAEFSELSEKAIVQAVGVDYLPDKKLYRLSILYFNPESEGGQNQIDKTQANVLKSVGEGQSIGASVADASVKSGKALLFNENNLIVIGGELCKYNIAATLDYFVSNFHSHPKTYVTAAEGTAEEIMDIRFKEGAVSTQKLTRLIENAEKHGTIQGVYVYEAMTRLKGCTGSVYIPTLSVTEEATDVTVPKGSAQDSKGGGGQGGQSEEQQSEKTVEISGGTLFVNFVAAGSTDIYTSSAVQLLNNGTDNMFVTTELDDGRKASLTLSDVSLNISPITENGRLHLEIRLIASGRYEELILISQSDDRTLHEIKERAEEKIKVQLESALAEIKDRQGADVFGIENAIRHTNTDFWFENAENMPSVIQQADYTVEVEFHPYLLGL